MAIITVSRQMGTGAYQIAHDVARRLKYSLVDGERIAELATAYDISSEALQQVDEKPPVSIANDDQRHAAHLSAIELLLLESCRAGNVLIYGRGGQDLLAGMDNVLRLRFVAPFEERMENFAEREWLDPDLARTLIRKSDQQRGGFIHFYFDRDWNDPLGDTDCRHALRLVVDVAGEGDVSHRDFGGEMEVFHGPRPQQFGLDPFAEDLVFQQAE